METTLGGRGRRDRGLRRGVREAGRDKDLTSGPLRVSPFVLLLSSGVSPVSSRPSPSFPPDSGSPASPDTREGSSVSGFSDISDKAFPEQVLLELDSTSDSESTSGPESSADELDSPSPPCLEHALWL